MKNLLTQALTNPQSITTYSEKEWEILVRQAKSAQLVATVWDLLCKHNLSHLTPLKAVHHFLSQTLLVERQNELFRFEIEKVYKAINRFEPRIIVLKGAAYLLLDLPIAKCRRMADIDILVKKDHLSNVEKELLFYGWVKTKTDNYDDMYYREWMHEIPPLQHINRGSVLDVHHNILPVIAKNAPDAHLLSEASIPTRDGRFYTLSAEDMVLHSACHLFHEGEFEKGLRDLYDLDQLFLLFSSKDKDFWENLLKRAVSLRLEIPLFFALRYTHRIFSTDIPPPILKQSELFSNGSLWVRIYDFLFTRIFVPHHPSTHNLGFGFSRFILYWRSHLIKMPLHILIPHLFKKAIKGFKEKKLNDQRAEV